VHAETIGQARSGRGRAGGERDRGGGPDGCRRAGDHQGRHPALAVGHDGDLGDDVEGRHAHAHRRAEQEGRPARQEARGGGGRPSLELAAVRREGPRAHHQGQGLGRVRLLDLRVAEIRAAGLQGTQLDPVLPGPVRGRRERAQRVLHRRGPEPAGDPGRRLPDEGREGAALGARGHRLRLPAHDQQDP
jgi:hypothetical protein